MTVRTRGVCCFLLITLIALENPLVPEGSIVPKKGGPSHNNKQDSSSSRCLEQFEVMPSMIIRTKDSVDAGADYLTSPKVTSFAECREECCSLSDCDTAVFEEESSSALAGPTCYLFRCGDNDTCRFVDHQDYQSAQKRSFQHVQTTTEMTTTVRTTTTVTTTTTKPTEATECPNLHFQCQSDGRCVPLALYCDGTSDCDDDSDEYDCDGGEIGFGDDGEEGSQEDEDELPTDEDLKKLLEHYLEGKDGLEDLLDLMDPSTTTTATTTTTTTRRPHTTTTWRPQPVTANDEPTPLSNHADQKESEPGGNGDKEPSSQLPDSSDGESEKSDDSPSQNQASDEKSNSAKDGGGASGEDTVTVGSDGEGVATTRVSYGSNKSEGLSTLAGGAAKLDAEDPGVFRLSPANSAILPLAVGLAITAFLLIMVACRLRAVKRELKKGRWLADNQEADYLINGMYL